MLYLHSQYKLFKNSTPTFTPVHKNSNHPITHTQPKHQTRCHRPLSLPTFFATGFCSHRRSFLSHALLFLSFNFLISRIHTTPLAHSTRTQQPISAKPPSTKAHSRPNEPTTDRRTENPSTLHNDDDEVKKHGRHEDVVVVVGRFVASGRDSPSNPTPTKVGREKSKLLPPRG